jgi:hypothetical protein
MKATYSGGETVVFDVKAAGIQWVNNGASSYGLRVGISADYYLRGSVPAFTVYSPIYGIDPADRYVYMFNNRFNLEFAGATHANPQWRPYYVISYTTVGGLSVTARVPVGDAAVSTQPQTPTCHRPSTWSPHGRSDP